ncbi:MAG: hypothetical protein KKH52_01795 [Nanoarchaeota archaeon]|nr:hypothetical protein [Nanoarchaeota archaeon]MBU1622339.1 hypothetical protein [Nanoarchaeota archaeon]MBU1974104.1 hypothetical protein [Nanoarchaeota archaeon]
MANDFGSLMGLFLGFAVFGLLIGIGLYVYMALALMTVAKRLKDKQPWLAWIPVANLVLMARLAKMHWWPVLLVIGMIIPFVNFVAGIALLVFTMIWMWKICEARKRPGWWAILVLIPFVGGIWGLVMWGILAWSKK